MATKGSRFGELRSSGRGAGYDTTGREKFSHKVEFSIDYSDVELGKREAMRLLQDFKKELNLSMDGIKTSGSFVYADSDFSNAYDMSKTVEVISDKILEKDVYTFAKEIAAESKDTIKKYIGGRVDTGRMKGSVYGRTRKEKGRVVAEAGWLDLWYKYFGFQEDGTQKISPMRSMLRTYLELAPWVQKSMSEYMRNFVKGKGYKR